MRRSTDSLLALFLLLLISTTQCGIDHPVRLTVRGKSERRLVVLRDNIEACGNLRRSRGRPTINTSDSADHFARCNVLCGGPGMIN